LRKGSSSRAKRKNSSSSGAYECKQSMLVILV
jgi:hypothetical protein